MTEITLETRIAKSDEIVAGKIDDEFVMMSIDNGKYYLMNPTGSRIWALLDEPRTIGELCAVLTGEFKITAADCQKEVVEFIDQLAARQVVKVG
ncbi:MAG: PqqD family protein [Chloroflexi bacterium]|nr:PqqD family protein [Chloroflexota bacterium]